MMTLSAAVIVRILTSVSFNNRLPVDCECHKMINGSPQKWVEGSVSATPPLMHLDAMTCEFDALIFMEKRCKRKKWYQFFFVFKVMQCEQQHVEEHSSIKWNFLVSHTLLLASMIIR